MRTAAAPWLVLHICALHIAAARLKLPDTRGLGSMHVRGAHSRIEACAILMNPVVLVQLAAALLC